MGLSELGRHGLSLASRETTQTKKSPKHYSGTGCFPVFAINVFCLLLSLLIGMNCTDAQLTICNHL